jgi:hypothetical protein
VLGNNEDRSAKAVEIYYKVCRYADNTGDRSRNEGGHCGNNACHSAFIDKK